MRSFCEDYFGARKGHCRAELHFASMAHKDVDQLRFLRKSDAEGERGPSVTAMERYVSPTVDDGRSALQYALAAALAYAREGCTDADEGGMRMTPARVPARPGEDGRRLHAFGPRQQQ